MNDKTLNEGQEKSAFEAYLFLTLTSFFSVEQISQFHFSVSFSLTGIQSLV